MDEGGPCARTQICFLTSRGSSISSRVWYSSSLILIEVRKGGLQFFNHDSATIRLDEARIFLLGISWVDYGDVHILNCIVDTRGNFGLNFEVMK